MRKKIILTICLALCISIIPIYLLLHNDKDGFECISSIKQLEGFEKLEIEQVYCMNIKECADSGNMVSTRDKAMISEMVDYLENLELSFSNTKVKEQTLGGGGCVAEFLIDGEIISVACPRLSQQIKIKDSIFDIVSCSVENPIEKLYNEGKEKFGLTKVWNTNVKYSQNPNAS